MLMTNVRERTTGFRKLTDLELAAVSGGLDPLPGDDGPPIIVTGSPYGVSQDWLDLTNSSIGDFFDQLSGNNHDPFQDAGPSEGGGGGGNQSEEDFSDVIAEVTIIPVDDDGEQLEALENSLEKALDTLGAQSGENIDFAVEYDQVNGVFIAESNVATPIGFTLDGALEVIATTPIPADPPTT